MSMTFGIAALGPATYYLLGHDLEPGVYVIDWNDGTDPDTSEVEIPPEQAGFDGLLTARGGAPDPGPFNIVITLDGDVVAEFVDVSLEAGVVYVPVGQGGGPGPSPTTWLDADVVIDRLGPKIGGDLDADTLDRHAAGVRAYIEDRRGDLWAEDADTGDLVFTPGEDVVLGAAMLAFRLYQRRTMSPGDAIAADVELRRLLGLKRRFVFGASVEVIDE